MIATISRWISIVGGSTLLIVGTVGAICNILVFSHSTLRRCSCSWYILTAAFFDLITLDHALLLRILADGFGIDLISIHTVYCRLRFYTGQIASFVPITLICLAAIDRWAIVSLIVESMMLSCCEHFTIICCVFCCRLKQNTSWTLTIMKSTSRSVRTRQWSSIRVARYSIIITILVWSVLSVPNLLVYQVINGLCQQTSLTYNNYSSFFLNPILYGALPVTVLASFGYATHVNIHQLTNRQQRNRGKLEDQLTKSIILQCASFILAQVPYTLWNLYLTFTRNEKKSTFRTDLETLFTQLTRLLFYLAFVSTFYINLIASHHVRKVMRSYLFLLKGRCIPIDNHVHPFTNTISRSTQPPGRANVTQPNIQH